MLWEGRKAHDFQGDHVYHSLKLNSIKVEASPLTSSGINFDQIENINIKSLEYICGHPVSRVVNLNFINVVA